MKTDPKGLSMRDATSSSSRRLISSGSEFERTYNYSRAVAIGPYVALSGTTGYDYATSTLPEGAREQALQLFRNAEAAFAKAGASLADVIRVRIYISDASQYETIMAVYAETFEGVAPACTTVEAGLFDPAIVVEMDMDAAVDVAA
jgi:enamine deaminase RidA (YjgF/YER057c/UK114 family)